MEPGKHPHGSAEYRLKRCAPIVSRYQGDELLAAAAIIHKFLQQTGLICAAALLTAGFCSCSSTGTHAISPASDAAYREYINKINQEQGLNL